MLIDTYGRRLSYLRLSVTDRCNFRCYYCMPELGADFADRAALLCFDEIEQLTALFVSLGVTKVRITGGEPFVRKGLMPFLEKMSQLNGLDEITLTTNGTLVEEHLQSLLKLGIRKVNLSLDSLSRERFFRITRRDCFDAVFNCIHQMLGAGFELKLNCVVSPGKNTEDIIPFIELTKLQSLSVRFLEEMPFNGGDHLHAAVWNHTDILGYIQGSYATLERLQDEPASTSVNYRVPGYAGSFGVIPSFSRTFCGSCNRLRLSATGELRTCLYGPPAVNLRDLMRSGAGEDELRHAIVDAVSRREQDGFAAEKANASVHHSMALLGG